MTKENLGLDLQVSNLGTNKEPYIVYKSLVLKRFANQLKIQRKDRKSLRIRRNLAVHYAKALEFIETIRDGYIRLVFENLEYEQAIQKLLTFLTLLEPVEKVWADLIKRCTRENLQYETTMPFNYNFEEYKGNYITKTQNGMIKLQIPGRIRGKYMDMLHQAYKLMSQSYKTLKSDLTTLPRSKSTADVLTQTNHTEHY